MTGGNTLLAHCVGTGKTFEMVAAAMKMKQAGLVNKSMAINLHVGPGPRAVFNALERLVASYPGEQSSTQQDKAVAESQLRDYETRLGAVFTHDAYQRKLTELRDRLKAGLSEKSAEPKPDEPSVAELAEQIKSLRAESAVEAAPARTGTRKAARVERPVTARIRERHAEPPLEAEAEQPVALAPKPVEAPVVVAPVEQPPAEDNVIAMPEPRPITPLVSFVQRVKHGRKAGGGNDASQMTLFG